MKVNDVDKLKRSVFEAAWYKASPTTELISGTNATVHLFAPKRGHTCWPIQYFVRFRNYTHVLLLFCEHRKWTRC